MIIIAVSNIRGDRICRLPICQRRVGISLWAQFKKDWKQMQDATKPRPNPNPDEPEVNLRNVISLPLRSHWLVLKESAQLYVLTWTNRNEAVNILTKDEIMIEQARARKETGEKIETADFIKSVEELYPKLMKDMEKVGSVGDVVGVVSSNKEELKKVATDRLEIMGEALHQFMEGYREGRDAGHREAMEDDKFVQSMFDLTNAHDNGRDAAEASASAVVANASGAKPDGEGRASSGPNTSVVRDADARVADKSTSANNQASSETSNGRGAEASATTKVN